MAKTNWYERKSNPSPDFYSCVDGPITIDEETVVIYSKNEPNKIGEIYRSGSHSKIIKAEWRKSSMYGKFLYILHEDSSSEYRTSGSSGLIADKSGGIMYSEFAQPEDYANYPKTSSSNSSEKTRDTSFFKSKKDKVSSKTDISDRMIEEAMRKAEEKAKEEAEKARLNAKTEKVKNIEFDPTSAQSLSETLVYLKAMLDEDKGEWATIFDGDELKAFRKAALSKYSEVLTTLKRLYDPQIESYESNIATWKKSIMKRKFLSWFIILLPLIIFGLLWLIN
ncbi:MAG: hypothetical protein IJU90_07985 [Bacteroidales bacterium]|nr:hypothetical protein [Bacteroidales bacterium]